MKRHSHVADFANLDFEAIDTEILADEVNEKEGETIVEATKVVGGEGAAIRGANDEAQTETDRVEEIVNVPWIKNLSNFFFFHFKDNGCLLF